MEKVDIKSQSLEELTQEMKSQGLPEYRARQLYQWLHEKLADSFGDMGNLPKELRERLGEAYELVVLEKVDVRISKTDGTRKYLFRLPDGHVIESVLMKYKYGNSVCISSQAGCRMGCRFCASALGGLARNLRPSEMLEQVYRIQKDLGERVSHVVVMGSGEPLDNYEHLIRFLSMLTDEHGLHVSQRNVAVSTCGIVPNIKRLADENLQITLALSLHAPNDQIRKQLMPIAGQYKLDDVLAACQEYFRKTSRRVTFEYSLIRGVNDHLEEARQLARRLRGCHGHVNLIPVNPIRERDYVQSAQRDVQAFKLCLEKNGIHVTIRRELGRDIGGACGQLRKSYLEQKKGE